MSNDAIFQALEGSTKTNSVEVGGQTLTLRELSTAEFLECSACDDAAQSDALLIAYAFDSFSREDIDRIKALPARITREMAQAVMSVMGIGDEAEKS